ncbi:hypothetical protein GF373_03035 [bacterium]|nr:hypothetical protein [bacterium]
MQRKQLISYFLVVSMFALVLAASSVQAVVLFEKQDRHWVEQADLIFMGTVMDKQYRASDPVKGQEEPVPHTFVTVAVSNIMKGSVEGNDGDGTETITLRFQGGPTTDGRLLVVRGTPLFDVGDTGMFFVVDNGSGMCPLVGWRQGFIRVLNDGELILNDLGTNLYITSKPKYAARIHPDDIHLEGPYGIQDAPSMISQLQNLDDFAVERIYGYLSDYTKQLIGTYPEQPTQLDALPNAIPKEMRAHFADHPHFDAASIDELSVPQGEEPLSDWPVPDNFLHDLLPDQFKVQAETMLEAMLIRDLNILLMIPDLMPPSFVSDMIPQPRDEELVYSDPANLSLEQIVLRNRRIMEAAFYGGIVPSPDQTMIRGEYTPHPEILINTIGEDKFEMFMPQEPESEGPQTEAEALPEDAEKVTVSLLLAHVNQLMNVIHPNRSPGDYKPVPNLDPELPFTIQPPDPLTTPITYDVPDGTESMGDEEQMIMENEGNPVLK